MRTISAFVFCCGLLLALNPALAQLQPPNVTRYPDISPPSPPAPPPSPAKDGDAKAGDRSETQGAGNTTVEVTREPGKTTIITTVPTEPAYQPMGAGGYQPMGR